MCAQPRAYAQPIVGTVKSKYSAAVWDAKCLAHIAIKQQHKLATTSKQHDENAKK